MRQTLLIFSLLLGLAVNRSQAQQVIIAYDYIQDATVAYVDLSGSPGPMVGWFKGDSLFRYNAKDITFSTLTDSAQKIQAPVNLLWANSAGRLFKTPIGSVLLPVNNVTGLKDTLSAVLSRTSLSVNASGVNHLSDSIVAVMGRTNVAAARVNSLRDSIIFYTSGITAASLPALSDSITAQIARANILASRVLSLRDSITKYTNAITASTLPAFRDSTTAIIGRSIIPASRVSALRDSIQFYTNGITAGTLPGLMDSILKYAPVKSQQVVSRALTTSFQPSLTRWTIATYSYKIDVAIALLAGQTGTIFMEISANNSTWVNPSQLLNAANGVLNLNNSQGAPLLAFVPPGWYVRLRFVGTTSTPTSLTGQEFYL